MLYSVTFHHQDGDLSFHVVRALFAIDEEPRLALSIECAENSEHDWMATPCFSLIGFPLVGPVRPGLEVRLRGRDIRGFDFSPGVPRAHVYVGTHLTPRDVVIRFTRECQGVRRRPVVVPGRPQLL